MMRVGRIVIWRVSLVGLDKRYHLILCSRRGKRISLKCRILGLGTLFLLTSMVSMRRIILAIETIS